MELLKEELSLTETQPAEKAIAYADGDVIVPDVKPDILKILQVDAASTITSKEISGSTVKIWGIVKYSILYIPDKEGECIKSILTEMPFSHTIDKKQISNITMIDISTDIERVEFTLLNSRKLNIKTAVSLNMVLYETKTLTLASGIDFEKAEVIYQTINTENLDALEEYNFTLRDRLEIPSGRATISEILKLDINISDPEVKAISGKAVIKGNVILSSLYTDTNGEIQSISGEIPFTEIAEIFDLEEDSPCNVEYRLKDYSYITGLNDDGEPGSIDFDISITAVVSSFSQKNIQIMKDCFCPGLRTEMVYNPSEFENILSRTTNQYTIKEILSPDKKLPQITSVYNVIAKPFITKATPQKGKVMLEGHLDVYILYITDNPQIPIYSFKGEIPLNLALDNDQASDSLLCSAGICCEHLSYNLNMANEVELRCTLSCNVRLSCKETMNVISDCTLCQNDQDFGIVIYFVQPGDSLWQIAKRYSVAVSDIAKFNNIPEEDIITPGQRLIIPCAS